MSIRKLGTTLAGLACLLLAIPSFADSQARIVRLSDVEGNVQIDRNTGQGYEKAILNMPITQGTKLQTKADARAEVEFEDGSALRITPNTLIEFPQLSLRDAGGRASTVTLQEGTAYVNFKGSKSDELTLNFGHEKLTLAQPAHLRVEMGDTQATVAVFTGDVNVEGPSGTLAVGKKQSATFDLADSDKYKLAKSLESDPFDSWDKQQAQYHDRYMSSDSSDYSSPYGYGMSDLNYYGSYSNIPGYGMMWQPYFAGAGWDPFMNGAWVYYPGFGYTWVSGYPWGWMPYYYGSWYYMPTYGWMWQQPSTPGSWGGWNGTPRVVNPPPRFTQPQPPTTPDHKTVFVGRGTNPALGVSQNRITVRKDSAGLGIPRGSIRNLGKISETVKQRGAITTTIHTAPAAPAMGAPPASTPRTVTPAPRATPHMSAPAPHTATPHAAPPHN
ncbi:MAG: FecR domain-containing protein [Acidobacteriia bacterium]|nr:FecR domain-containing protein [Terriglobia bacterium]